MTVLLGLLGGKGSGKDTAARYLCQKLGGKQYAIADELKHLVKRIYGFTDMQMWGTQAEKEAGDPSPRKGMEDVGPALREVYGATFQVERLLNKIALDAPDVTVISDVRYASEAQSLRQRGALLIRLQYAPGLRRWPSSHQSEQEYQSVPVDLEITPGAGGVSELYAALDRACEMLGLTGKKAISAKQVEEAIAKGKADRIAGIYGNMGPSYSETVPDTSNTNLTLNRSNVIPDSTSTRNVNWKGIAKFLGSTPAEVKDLPLTPSIMCATCLLDVQYGTTRYRVCETCKQETDRHALVRSA